ncbi:MAG: HDOD domain-containing protein [Desulfobacteraceae bacterium]|nr:MAG: HDOD domain-containing protein [Desulfobacteraceae bacterium]
MYPNQPVSFNAVSIGLHSEIHEIINRDLSAREFRLQKAEDLSQLGGIIKQGIPDVLYVAADDRRFDPFALSLKLARAGVVVLMISVAPTRELLVKAARHGAMDFLVSPLQPSLAGLKTEQALIKKGKKPPNEGLGTKIDFGSARTPYEKMKVVVKNINELLALPFAVVKIIRLCNDPNASAKDLELPVKSDPAIAAMIMRRANSAAFGSTGRATSIQRAVLRIGMRATRNIASSFSVFKLFEKEEKSFGFNRIWFWQHSLASGICAQALATILKYPQPEDAFLAGLLHDIGKMVLDDFLNEEFDKAIRIANTDGVPMRMAENSIFQTTHAYIGSKLAQAWGFPSAIAEGIGQHHLYQKLAETGSGFSLGAIVCMANQMSKAIQAGSGGDYIVERESSSLWNRVPKDLSWRKILGGVLDELNAYTEVLEVPPEKFRLELPASKGGKAGVFLPGAGHFGPILRIALEHKGLEPVFFSTLEKRDGLTLVIGDLSSVRSREELADLQKGISSIHEKAIVIPPFNEKDTPLNLDFFWLESQLKHFHSPSVI